MRNIRQARKKQTSLQHPATSLHLMQVSKFIEEYLHAQQKYLINLSAASVQTHLPLREQSPNHSFDIDLNVPYIESEHYDSHATFTEEQNKLHLELDDENFTDREGFNSVSMESEAVSCKQRKLIELDEEDEENLSGEDFQFIKNTKKSRDAPFLQSLSDKENSQHLPSSTDEGEQSSKLASFPNQEEIQLHHLQETAYFLQEKERVDRKLMYSTLSSHNNENLSMIHNQAQPLDQTKGITSKKAIFLNKIEKERSRKEIAEAINRERHHIKKFLK